MAELKKIRVRQAKPRDVGLFKKLWSDFLLEQQEKGSIVRGDSEKNLEVYTNVFHMYVNDSLSEDARHDGIVLFIGEIAVLMAGDPGTNVELTIGNCPARVWGMHIAPDHRDKELDLKLYDEAFKHLREMGFDSVMTTALSANTLESNLVKVSKEQTVYMSLEK